MTFHGIGEQDADQPGDGDASECGSGDLAAVESANFEPAAVRIVAHHLDIDLELEREIVVTDG